MATSAKHLNMGSSLRFDHPLFVIIKNKCNKKKVHGGTFIDLVKLVFGIRSILKLAKS